MIVGLFGILGPMLPALDGQKTGDPESTAFRVGAPMGVLAGLLAVALGAICVRRAPDVGWQHTLPNIAIGAGVVALLLTAALVFSG